MSVIDDIRKLPPVTRFTVISSISVTLCSMLDLVSPSTMLYSHELAFGKMQLWRVYTSIFLASHGIHCIFEVVWLYHMMNDLESGPYAFRSADLAWQLFVACVGIIVASIPVYSPYLFHSFLLCIAYVGSSLAPPGAQTSLLGLVTLPARYLPFIVLGMDLLVGGPHAVAVVLPGAVVGHLWWWGIWGPGGVLRQWGAAPRWLAEWMRQRPSAPGTARANAGGRMMVNTPYMPMGAMAMSGYYWGLWGMGRRLGRPRRD